MQIEFSEQAQHDATRWVDDLLGGAVTYGISDLQLRLDRDNEVLTARGRINRIMQDIAIARGRLAIETVNRVKSAASIPTGPAQSIEDGLYEFTPKSGSRIDVRAAIFPTVEGEVIQLRLPAQWQSIPQLADVKLNRVNAVRLAHLLGVPNGLILLAGPMGAGKTTTMYAVLNKLGGPDRNVFTVEDPVERVLPGTVQIQINERAGNGWPDVLKGLRRSDLELLMIGEIRNKEQAAAALEIGNAGAKVVSSIHANDSVGAVHQLLELSGAAPRQLGNQLRGVVSQRLLRAIHQECRGQGCPVCDGSGYKGLRPIHEVLLMSDDLVQALVEGASAAQLRAISKARGMQSLWGCAEMLIAEGVTDEKEAMRVLGSRPRPGDADYDGPSPHTGGAPHAQGVPAGAVNQQPMAATLPSAPTAA